MKYFFIYLILAFVISQNICATGRQKSTNPSDNHLLRRKKRWEFTTYRILEHTTSPQKISTLHSSFDNDDGNITYSITGQGAGSLFSVDPKTGVLTALHQLDREVQSSYYLNVSARNSEGVEVEDSTSITIEVDDKNDNNPRFTQTSYHASVREMSKIGTLVTTMTATDKDDPNGPYGTIEYSILPSNDSSSIKFVIDRETGEVRTTTTLDYEQTKTYRLKILARDDPNADLFRSATTTLTIKVKDVNDNPPVFTERPYRATVAETTDIGSEIAKVKVNDGDHLKKNILTSFEILPGPHSSKFSIKSVENVGVVELSEKLDYESSDNREYRFTVRARNVHVESDPTLDYLAPLEDTTDVIVSVTDVNEPPEFLKSSYSFSVKEDADIKYPLFNVDADDPEGDFFTYWINDVTDTFLIDQKTGFVSLKRKLDRESTISYHFNVMAGRPDSFNQAALNIQVEDVNDHPPIPLSNNSLQLFVCTNLKNIVQPNITMKDDDSPYNGAPFRYIPVNDELYNKDFRLVDNHDNTATLQTIHNNFYVDDEGIYKFRFIVEDSGKPKLNATYQAQVRVCHCERETTCVAVTQAGGIGLGIFFVVLGILLILLIISVSIALIRRKRARSEEALIKGSFGSIDMRENFISYNEEGGGEEDTSAFDLAALQGDYINFDSNSITKNRSGFPTPPSTIVSSFPPSTNKRPFIPSQTIGDFIANVKEQEDNDDRKLAYDSLQVYGYEGEGSDAGSLSSLFSSTSDSDQDYDYLKDWGPRFGRLADMYGTRGSGFGYW